MTNVVSILDAPFAPKILRLHLTNFLSYRHAVLDFDDFVALVGPNAAGKSNAVAAIKLLREIPLHGLATAIARRGGFDQLRHRSKGHPYDPALRLEFQMSSNSSPSFYELRLRALSGKRYEVKDESAEVFVDGARFHFHASKGRFLSLADGDESPIMDRDVPLPPGQSAVALAVNYGAYLVSRVLSSLQTVEINPSRVAELQDPSSTREFEPDGSNTVSIYDELPSQVRQSLSDELSSIVPGISRVEVRRLADKMTFSFIQTIGSSGRREFFAKQMSDGTLRAFSILLAMAQEDPPALLVIEEPEIAIHLGALRTLVDILKQQTDKSQILITTHSADIVDALDVDSLRVVWTDEGASNIARVASHTLEPVRKGLITPGELLRSDSLDPAV